MKRIVTLTVSALLFIAALVSYICAVGSFSDRAYFGRDYAVLRVFDKDGITPSEISTVRFAVDEASTADAEDDGRLWCDGYSYFTEVYVSRPDQAGVNSRAIVTGGDFFLLHRLDFVNGWYYTDTDLHLDRVVIDERLAFQLYGSNNAEGMSLTVGGKTCYVAGVVALDESQAKELQLGTEPLIYIPQLIAESLFGERSFDSYEVMMQDPVDSYAYNTVSAVLQDKEVVDVTNRFGLKKIFGLIKDFPTRSYRTESAVYPYWENVQRGEEDILAVLLILNAVTAVVFAAELIIFIAERKRS